MSRAVAIHYNCACPDITGLSLKEYNARDTGVNLAIAGRPCLGSMNAHLYTGRPNVAPGWDSQPTQLQEWALFVHSSVLMRPLDVPGRTAILPNRDQRDPRPTVTLADWSSCQSRTVILLRSRCPALTKVYYPFDSNPSPIGWALGPDARGTIARELYWGNK